MYKSKNTPQPIPDDLVFERPLMRTDEAAAFLNCSALTLRDSRKTGRLFGIEAPPYVRRGRSIVYRRDSLAQWEQQFEEQTNSAQGLKL